MPQVEIEPMPAAYLRIPPRLRPGHPPILHGAGEVTADDRELALALFCELDVESRRWYLNGAATFCGLPVPAEFLPAASTS